MKPVGTPLTSTQSDATPQQLLDEIFEALVRLLRLAGLSDKQTCDALERSLGSQEMTKGETGPVHLGATQRDCMEIMCLWRRDPRFLSPTGLPKSLPLRDTDVGFAALCRAAGAQAPIDEILGTLATFGAVQILPDGSVRPETPTFLLRGTIDGHRFAADGVLKQVAGFMRVIDYNTRGPVEGRRSRFERACTVVVAEELLPVFERVVRERGQEFIDVLDEWLERHRQTVSPTGNYVEVGAGAYFVDLGSIK